MFTVTKWTLPYILSTAGNASIDKLLRGDVPLGRGFPASGESPGAPAEMQILMQQTSLGLRVHIPNEAPRDGNAAGPQTPL